MRYRRFFSAAFLLLAAVACSNQTSTTVPPTPQGFGGIVESGTRPISGALVTLLRAGSTGYGQGAQVLATTQSGSSGRFTFHLSGVPSGSGPLYAIAERGNVGSGSNASIAFMALAGSGNNVFPSITIDERSTVAMAYAFAQFSDAGGTIVGSPASNADGLNRAAFLAQARLVEPRTGKPAAFFPSASSCSGSGAPENCEGLERLNTVANALAACARSAPTAPACPALFTASGATRLQTLSAVHAIVLDPSRDPAAIYALAKSEHVFAPAVSAVPSAWAIGLKYVGNGKEFDGPGNFVFDKSGNLWITNNYQWAPDPHVPACGGDYVIELTPYGDDAPGAPFSGGGLAGVGWGITLDDAGTIWLGNFGFVGRGCTTPPADQSASQFSASGKVLSPATGWTQGPIDRPQGTVLDLSGNIWFANFANGSLTVYRGANPQKSANYSGFGVKQPFGAAIDASNRIWVTGEGSNNVALVGNDGKPVPGSPFGDGITRPLGEAVDMDGNDWIASNGSNSIVVLDSNAKPALGSPITGGGISLPWGVAVDGNDNVWIANFNGATPRVSEICGKRGNCPRGLAPGKTITPGSGYRSTLLQRLTGLGIDESGNLWVLDNWRRIPFQTNPGGDGAVEFVGLAGPAKAPAVGPVQRP